MSKRVNRTLKHIGAVPRRQWKDNLQSGPPSTGFDHRSVIRPPVGMRSEVSAERSVAGSSSRSRPRRASRRLRLLRSASRIASSRLGTSTAVWPRRARPRAPLRPRPAAAGQGATPPGHPPPLSPPPVIPTAPRPAGAGGAVSTPGAATPRRSEFRSHVANLSMPRPEVNRLFALRTADVRDRAHGPRPPANHQPRPGARRHCRTARHRANRRAGTETVMSEGESPRPGGRKSDGSGGCGRA